MIKQAKREGREVHVGSLHKLTVEKGSELTKHFQGLKTQLEQYELELDRQLARMDLKTPLFSRGVTHIHTISIVYMIFVMYKMISRPLIFHHSFRH